MKQKIILLALPALLLSSCSQGISYEDWTKTATEQNNNVVAKTDAKEYPFTKYTMVGSMKTGIVVEEVNGEYTFNNKGNWWSSWDFEYKGEDLIPARPVVYELYRAVTFVSSYGIYVGKEGNEFSWSKSGSSLSVTAKYKSVTLEEYNLEASFNEFGFIKSYKSKSVDGQIDYNFTFTYSN